MEEELGWRKFPTLPKLPKERKKCHEVTVDALRSVERPMELGRHLNYNLFGSNRVRLCF
jgi:hypothetical protein